MRLNVLLYNGPGVSSFQDHLLQMLKHYLSDSYDVIFVDSNTLLNEPWEESTALLVIPGGQDLPYIRALEHKGLERIKQFVTNNGNYLGICAGAYLASDSIEFEVGQPNQVVGQRMSLLKIKSVGSVGKHFEYASEQGASALKIKYGSVFANLYVNGGPAFELMEQYQVLASYDDGRPAVVQGNYGSGNVILTGPHVEIDGSYIKYMKENAQNPEDAQYLDPLIQPVLETEETRELLWIDILTRFGLKLNAFQSAPQITPMICYGDNARFLKAYEAQSLNGILIDQSNSWILVKQHAQIQLDALPPEWTKQPKIKTQHLSLQEGTSDSKHFSFSKYKQDATTFGQQVLGREPVFGSLLIYAETTSSTQTILDTNPLFASLLPQGTPFVATNQVKGRGRGKNGWISQEGCLQFSFKVSHPDSSRALFVQYLFGLTVVEGLKSIPGLQDIPVHLKWPNDIYCKTSQGLMKMGGILVTSEYKDKQFYLTVGCGLNVCNPKPTTCVQSLVQTPVSMETCLASIIVHFERNYLQMLETPGHPFDPFYHRYYEHWLHTNQTVTAQGEQVRIIGLSDQGLLRALSFNGKEVLLQPDGNSFDMFRGLITSKR
ncbi:biotin-protein ligase [Gorgonomyces haynaldii]|nr:biotin-protein ligase [Gorgonomyces haynaldii]